MTLKKSDYVWLLIASLVFLAIATDIRAQAAPATVRPEPPAVEVAAGTTQTIAVVIEGAADVYGIDVRASFDPSRIEIVDADASKAGVQVIPGSFPQPDFVALNEADNGAGTLRYVVTQVNPTPPATGNGTIFTFQVRGKAGGEAELRIDLVEMSNRSGELLPVQTANGTVTVTGASPPAATGIVLPTAQSGNSQPAAPGGTPTTSSGDSSNDPIPATQAAPSSGPPAAAATLAATSAPETQASQPGSQATQPAPGTQTEEESGAATQEESAAIAEENNTGATPETTDPLAVTQPDSASSVDNGQQADSVATSAAVAVVGSDAPIAEDGEINNSAAATGPSTLIVVALVVVFILLAIMAVILLRRYQSG